CKNLIQNFDAVSVRESSGVELCKTYLNRDAIHVMDPTMLLDTEVYKEITIVEGIEKSKGNLKVYILDKSEEKDGLVQLVEEKLNLKAFEVLPKKRLNEERVTDQNVSSFIYPSPAEWLRGFQDAKFVITD